MVVHAASRLLVAMSAALPTIDVREWTWRPWCLNGGGGGNEVGISVMSSSHELSLVVRSLVCVVLGGGGRERRTGGGNEGGGGGGAWLHCPVPWSTGSRAGELGLVVGSPRSHPEARFGSL